MTRLFALLVPTIAACSTADTDSADTGEQAVGCEEQAFAEALTWEESVALESAFIYQGVENPRALVLMFHAGGGNMEDNFERIDPALIAREPMTRGMAVASLNSYAHLDPAAQDLQWEETELAENNDIANVQEMIRKLTSATELDVVPKDTPLVLLGISNGGTMASRVAQIESLNVAAAAIYISNAQVFHEDDAILPPMVLIPGAQDPGQAAGSNTDLAQSIDDPEQALLIINQPEPVSEDLFTRIPEVNCDLSLWIRDALSDGGFLDSDGMVTVDPKEDQSWKSLLPPAADAHRNDIKDILVEAYAGHAPSSDQNRTVFDFLELNL
jgi:predicted esterase